VRNSRGRPINAPAAFIHPCRPVVVAEPPTGPGWAHELKHDGYRLQIPCSGWAREAVHDQWCGLVEALPADRPGCAKVKGSAIIGAEVVWLDAYGMSNFQALHSRANDARASACAFDLLMRDGHVRGMVS
jgi:bifunctional non-homologous end joining protein LigD